MLGLAASYFAVCFSHVYLKNKIKQINNSLICIQVLYTEHKLRISVIYGRREHE